MSSYTAEQQKQNMGIKFCSNCGHAVGENENFCVNCGNQLRAAAPGSSASTAYQSQTAQTGGSRAKTLGYGIPGFAISIIAVVYALIMFIVSLLSGGNLGSMKAVFVFTLVMAGVGFALTMISRKFGEFHLAKVALIFAGISAGLSFLGLII